ncbi:MAG TPA: LysR family transcriptional regulator, partial [Thiolinea sp.]|nr:LysR family transcriptional regulator [Thiolinea sp.]
GDIALFVAVVSAKSFTKAAEHLEMPVSTLSRRISALETAIGFRLLNRTTRRLEMTLEGEAYYLRCRDLVAEANLAHDSIKQGVQTVTGVLRLACTADFATQYLPQLLLQYTTYYPQVKVALFLNSRIEDLLDNHLDLALRMGPLPDSSLVAKPVANLQQGLFASPEFLKRYPQIQEPEDLTQVPCVPLYEGAAADWTLTHSLTQERKTVAVTGRITAGGPIMVHHLVSLGTGVGLLDTTIAHADWQAGRLAPVLPLWRAASVPVYAVTTSRFMPARVRTFIEWLTAHFH